MLSASPSGDSQFLITVVENFLGEIQTAEFLHFLTGGGGGAGRADPDFGICRRLAPGFLVTKTRGTDGPIHSDAAFAKTNLDALGFGGIHQRDVQVRARNGIDDLGVVLAVRLEREFTG